MARAHGLVKDRLRIKDATHVIADIAVPSTLALVAQIRDKLLAAAEPFAPLLVAGERVNLEQLREATATLKPAERLVTRLAQLREMLVWADALTPPDAAAMQQGQRTLSAFSCKDLHQVVNAPTGHATLHDIAFFARMLLDQCQRHAPEPG